MTPYFVYILLSEEDKKLYVGCTKDIEKRMRQHNNGSVPATKARRPFSLIHSESFSSKAGAFQRERFLKSLWSARFKQKILQAYLDKIGRQKI